MWSTRASQPSAIKVDRSTNGAALIDTTTPARQTPHCRFRGTSERRRECDRRIIVVDFYRPCAPLSLVVRFKEAYPLKSTAASVTDLTLGEILVSAFTCQ